MSPWREVEPDDKLFSAWCGGRTEVKAPVYPSKNTSCHQVLKRRKNSVKITRQNF